MYAEMGLDVTLTSIAHSARSCVGDVGYAMLLEGTWNVEFSATVVAETMVALGGRMVWKAEAEHSSAWASSGEANANANAHLADAVFTILRAGCLLPKPQHFSSTEHTLVGTPDYLLL